MKLALMCRNAGLYSHKRIVEAAERRGHDIDVVDHLRCYINITSHRPSVRYRGED
ncbi:MAG: 30S ribosomal protein S6--L-glutamate ligase, partial [Oricola sp.]|nr:30S ribosomal protein S6--L-glutamate ligase [Oricola sp.]